MVAARLRRGDVAQATAPCAHTGTGTLRANETGLKTYPVDVALLDDFADTIPPSQPIFIKIDTEFRGTRFNTRDIGHIVAHRTDAVKPSDHKNAFGEFLCAFIQ